MFDRIDRELKDWIESVQESVEVIFAPPVETAPPDCVSLHLLAVTIDPPARAGKLPPLQVLLRYLIVPSHQDAFEAHKILGNLLLAALENGEFEVEKESLSVEEWRAFGMTPRPSFILRVPFKKERALKPVALVRQPLSITRSPLKPLTGQIFGGKNLPIMNAKVELPEIGYSTVTDYQGRFRFAALPTEPPVKNLLVRAKGRAFFINTNQVQRSGETLVINLNLEE